MKTINLHKTWDRMVAETHRLRPLRDSQIKREALFALQVLLIRYELAKNEKRGELTKFYTDIFKIYERYNINKCIIWKR